MSLSVGQEKELTQTFGFTVCTTYEGGACGKKVGEGTMEISRLVEKRVYLGRALLISSWILVVAGKSLCCFFLKMKEEC